MESMDNTRGTILQQPNIGTIVYSSKDNAWQPMVTPISIIPTEIPKESIIANTDFTVTSVIAKRRLSNKKRRSQRISSGDDTLLQHSPPLSMSKRDDDSDITVSTTIPPSSTAVPPSSTTVQLSSTTTVLPLSSSSFTASHHQGGGGVVNGIIQPGTTQPCIPIATQVYSQTVPPEVVYQILHQHDITPSTTNGSNCRGDLQSMPHLPPHQLQYIESSTGQHLTYPHVPPSTQPQHSHSQPTTSSITATTTDTKQYKSQPQHVNEIQEVSSIEQHQHQMAAAAAVAQQQAVYHQHLQHQQLIQQQQHLAMMQQLYGVTPTGIVSSANAPISDIRQLQGGMPIVGHASHPNQLISVPIQTVYAPPTHHHSVPIATFAPPELLLQVQNGSWVSQSSAPPVFGSCIVNPIQPGLLTSSLVK